MKELEVLENKKYFIIKKIIINRNLKYSNKKVKVLSNKYIILCVILRIKLLK